MPEAPDAYTEFRDGSALLAGGHPHAAAVALERAKALEPAQASIREALARAYFRSARYAAAADEFRVVVDLDPVNDYAHYGLGRALSRLGDHTGAHRHLALACAMAPHKPDYCDALAELEARGER